MMSSTLIALLCVAPATAMLRGTGHQTRGKMQSDMRPEVVSQLLSNVEKKWVQGHMMVLRNVTDDASSYSTMEVSCLKVSSAIIAGSAGEKDRVVEYMKDVCSQESSKDASTADMCTAFASGVEERMTDDESFNRDDLDLKPMCKKFWEHTIAAAAQAEKEKLDAAEAKKAADEAAEQKKKEEEEEAKMKQEEEAKKAAEEAAEKEEAAAKAKEVAEAAASKAVEQNATQTQSQNTTVAEPEVKTEEAPAVEVPQTNATSAVAVETVTAPANNTSEPSVAAAPAEEVKSVNASDVKQVAATTNVTANATKAATATTASSAKPTKK